MLDALGSADISNDSRYLQISSVVISPLERSFDTRYRVLPRLVSSMLELHTKPGESRTPGQATLVRDD